MGQSHDPNKKYYFEKVSRTELGTIGQNYVQEEPNVIIWRKGESEADAESFICCEFAPTRLLFSLKMKKQGLLAKFKDSRYTGQHVFVRFANGNEHLFTTAKLVYDKDKKEYQISCNEDVFKTLQRQNYRLMADAKNKIQVKIKEGSVFDGVDLSAGGASFVIDAGLIDQFQKDITYTGCTVRLNRDRYNIEQATVVGNWALDHNSEDQPSKYKVAISFTQLAPQVEEALFKEINSIARVQEMAKSIGGR